MRLRSLSGRSLKLRPPLPPSRLTRSSYRKEPPCETAGAAFLLPNLASRVCGAANAAKLRTVAIVVDRPGFRKLVRSQHQVVLLDDHSGFLRISRQYSSRTSSSIST